MEFFLSVTSLPAYPVKTCIHQSIVMLGAGISGKKITSRGKLYSHIDFKLALANQHFSSYIGILPTNP